MRRNFAEILANSSIDIVKEYDKLTDMLYCDYYETYSGRFTLYQLLNSSFSNCRFRGTCLTLEEFDEKYKFDFPDAILPDEVDTLVSFCEYFYNLLEDEACSVAANLYGCCINTNLILNQIELVMERIGYIQSEMDGFIIYVERSAAAISVAESEIIPEDVSYKIISYDHHTMQGNIQEKKNTILRLADILEPKRADLEKADKELCNDLFYMFNNLNLRHNNIDPATKKYKKTVAEMNHEQLEQWYDETYQMCLLAFMTLEHADRKTEFDELKKKIELKQ